MRDALNQVWAGGEHAFRLGIGELRALQKACDAGPSEVLMRLVTSCWLVDDVVEVLRLALVGGGMESAAAKKLVLKVWEEVAPIKLSLLAASVMETFIMQDAHDPIEVDGKGDATGEPKAPVADGSSPASTVTAQ